ncbi:AfsA-related hotdog domain-containing protein [Streptomyces sp. NPDC008313]|uniref:AfsA-related hotdog domain-containing protein n=1 Tax=Streptomyces sp. NPDC008313 TaxID=3364826 RepID=UPI0036ED45D2
MRLEVVLTVGGRTCGRGALHVVAVDDKRYAMLRGRGARPAGAAVTGPAPRTVERVHPSAVGRLRTKDSVLVRERADKPWQLLVDVGHPIFFDHPSDHVPLMVTLEGVRQLGHLLLHPAGGGRRGAHSLLAMETDCQAFGELDVPIDLVVRERGAVSGTGVQRLTIDAVQDGKVLTACRSVWGPGPERVSATPGSSTTAGFPGAAEGFGHRVVFPRTA